MIKSPLLLDAVQRAWQAPFRKQVVATALLGGLWAVVPDTRLLGWLMLAASLVLVGIPHGANDLRLLQLVRPRWSANTRFGAYALTVVIATAAMLVYPLTGLGVFLVLSAFHFGQAEMVAGVVPDAVGGGNAGRTTLGFLYGLVLLLALLVPHAHVVGQYLPATPEFARAIAWLHRLPAAAGLYVTAAAALLAVAVAADVVPPSEVAGRLVSLLVLRLLFAHTELLFAFAVYFGVWHSPDSILLFSRQLFPGAGPRKVRQFYLAALPVTGLALGLGGLLWWLNQLMLLRYPLPFVILAFLFGVTVPHILVTMPVYRTAIREDVAA